jgi:hypothetical protein
VVFEMPKDVYDKLIEISQSNANRLAEVLATVAAIKNELTHKPDEVKVFKMITRAVDDHVKDKHSKYSMNPPLASGGIELTEGQKKFATHVGTGLAGALVMFLVWWFKSKM